MRFFSTAITSIAVAFLSYSSSGMAAPSGAIRLDEALKATLEHNPALAGYHFKADALAGEQTTASLRPEYRIAAELENVAGSGDLHGTQSGELTIAVSSVIELGNKRDARAGVVTARQQQLQSEQRLLSLDLLSAVTRQFLLLVAAQEQLAIHKDAAQLARSTQDSLRKLVQAGRLPEAELLRAEAGLARAAIALQQAEQQVRAERLRLSAYWADPTPDFATAQGDLYALIPSIPLTDLESRLDANPDLAVLVSEIDLRSAELREARSHQRADLEWSAGVRRFEETGDSAAVLGLSMPLGASRRGSGAVTTATAQHAGAEQALESARIRLQGELTALYDEQQQAVSELAMLRTRVVPALKRALRETAQGFDVGRYSYLEFTLAQSEFLDAQLAVIDAAQRAQHTRIELERLTGTAITDQHEVTP
ncbi:TolC family protein [Cellvibrio japonicus]|uniref:Cation efflux system protein n=1 Tax=Cellvibrio japonicus (strain Ueda107) TaxID=498211 RepID=B3PFX6_CELJU|nr:TolC family protein [Cellvibrio japonicus]ACE83188.1 cation efflux system protein [Cellvibrio japonicus Ueda107]QEI12341.1 TolC family protein [Cellvibrio japonicus]QEI15914.1 TolC family protein [Cellvibrio japonicus]QEI19493.1 TolC family protein [Cellvibrio japonicus]